MAVKNLKKKKRVTLKTFQLYGTAPYTVGRFLVILYKIIDKRMMYIKQTDVLFKDFQDLLQ